MFLKDFKQTREKIRAANVAMPVKKEANSLAKDDHHERCGFGG